MDICPHSSYCSDTGLCNNHDLDIILHKSLRLHLSAELFIVNHFLDCENQKIDTNIFFCNILRKALNCYHTKKEP